MATLTQQRRSLSDQLLAVLVALFQRLDSWRDRDRDRFTRQAVPLVSGAQQQLAALVGADIARQASAYFGRTVPPVTIPAAAVTRLRGVDPVEVYQRPFMVLRWRLSQGDSLTESVTRASTRLEEIAEEDLQHTYSVANREVLQRLPQHLQPHLWRRVLHGETSCGLCVLASTHRYTRSDLNPIHAHCDCSIQPIWGEDHWREDDDARLRQAHEQVRADTGTASARGVGYSNLVFQHGELGPVLTRPQ